MLLPLATLTFIFIAYWRRGNEEKANTVKDLQDLLYSERLAHADANDRAEALSLQLQSAQEKLNKLQQELRLKETMCDDCGMVVGSVQDSDTTSHSMCKQPEDVGSSSSSRPVRNYDAFLSFRGEDTRNNFVGHLYKALHQKGIYTFKDDEKLKRGKSISPELLKAIQESRLSIVVLSKNYATSSWCLDELVKIMECVDQFEHRVVPIFYNVEPSHVRDQTGSFAKAFAKHEKAFKEEEERVLKWRKALTRVGNISGWHSRDRDESTLIDQIVGDISNRVLYSKSSNDDLGLVGIDDRVQKLDSQLCNESGEVFVAGIWGMGGIGKTTLARAVYNRLSRQFEDRCFIENIKDRFREHGPKPLQEELLTKVLSERNLSLSTFDGGSNVIKNRLCHKKVLIVLDDVDHLDQLETLARKRDWFGPGSKIIIATRDKQLLDSYGVNYTYEVENLNDVEALQLFKKFAFKQNHPTEDYLELSNRFISYTKGLPLAVKVLGSFLYGKTIIEWKSELNKLQIIPDLGIQKVLRISYDGLDDKQKDIFLDIACFFNGRNKDRIMSILGSCYFSLDIDLRVLIDKSLVTISYNKLWMHDLIQAMGREVVRQEFVQEPGKRSRLWDPMDVYHVLKDNTGTEAIEGILFDTSKLKIKGADLSHEAFRRMCNLRFLKICPSHYKGFEENCKVNLHQELEFLPDKLTYLHWDGYPSESLPINFHPENLVELNMTYSNLEQLWEGDKRLPKLKRIDLSHSRHLKEIPDLSTAQNLESIILRDCTSLLEVHPSTCGLKSLKDLTLSGCSKLKICPEIPRNVKQVHLDGTIIQELHSSFQFAHKLEVLQLENCKNLVSLPDGLGHLKCLILLNLSGCSNLASLPENFGYLESLVMLDACRSGIKRLPSSITSLEKLETLRCRGCKGEDLTGLRLPPLSGLSSLTELDLRDCNLMESPEFLSPLPFLKSLCLDGNNFETLPASIGNLTALKFLSLNDCRRLQSLPELPPSIRTIDASDCTSLEVVTISSCERIMSVVTDANFESSTFIFINCYNLNQNARSNIIDVVQRKIQAVANASSPKLGQWPRISPTSICYPGSGLPEFFIHQRRGSKITIQLPSHHSNTYVPFALGAVVSFEDHCSDGNFILRCEFHLTSDTHDLGHPICFIDCSHNRVKNCKPISVQSDHVFLGFQNLFNLGCYRKAKAIIIFSFANDRENQSQLEGCKVKRCGAFPVYSDVG